MRGRRRVALRVGGRSPPAWGLRAGAEADATRVPSVQAPPPLRTPTEVAAPATWLDGGHAHRDPHPKPPLRPTPPPPAGDLGAGDRPLPTSPDRRIPRRTRFGRVAGGGPGRRHVVDGRPPVDDRPGRVRHG